jgi:hypothetical protein
MRRISLVAAFLMLGATAARADERVLDGALGGLAGAVVLGPVGLVGGALIGATAGPGISSSWGLSGHRRHRHHGRDRAHS